VHTQNVLYLTRALYNKMNRFKSNEVDGWHAIDHNHYAICNPDDFVDDSISPPVFTKMLGFMQRQNVVHSYNMKHRNDDIVIRIKDEYGDNKIIEITKSLSTDTNSFYSEPRNYYHPFFNYMITVHTRQRNSKTNGGFISQYNIDREIEKLEGVKEFKNPIKLIESKNPLRIFYGNKLIYGIVAGEISKQLKIIKERK